MNILADSYILWAPPFHAGQLLLNAVLVQVESAAKAAQALLRVIQCGSITLMLLLVMIALMRIPHFPIDYVAWLGPALFLLCMLTMFFLFQQGYRALRHRKTH